MLRLNHDLPLLFSRHFTMANESADPYGQQSQPPDFLWVTIDHSIPPARINHQDTRWKLRTDRLSSLMRYNRCNVWLLHSPPTTPPEPWPLTSCSLFLAGKEHVPLSVHRLLFIPFPYKVFNSFQFLLSKTTRKMAAWQLSFLRADFATCRDKVKKGLWQQLIMPHYLHSKLQNVISTQWLLSNWKTPDEETFAAITTGIVRVSTSLWSLLSCPFIVGHQSLKELTLW